MTALIAAWQVSESARAHRGTGFSFIVSGLTMAPDWAQFLKIIIIKNFWEG